MYRSLNELIDAGYIIRQRINDASGHLAYDYEVHESPLTNSPCPEKPYTDSPYTENPHIREYRDIENTDKHSPAPETQADARAGARESEEETAPPKPQSLAERTGLSDAELEAQRAAVEAQQRVIDERRYHRNENRELLARAVTHHLGIGGSRASKYVTMLEGRASAKSKKRSGDGNAFDEAAADLRGAPVSANEFTDFCEWYRRTVLKGNAHLNIVSTPDKLVGAILDGLARTEGHACTGGQIGYV